LLTIYLSPKLKKERKRKKMKPLMKQEEQVPRRLRKEKKRKRLMIYQNLQNGLEAQI
jgi:hypothetical protein